MITQWIDGVAGIAYISVCGREMAEGFLRAIESLLTHAAWRPDTPILEDLRELQGDLPPQCLDTSLSYLMARTRLSGRCRWAVVHRGDNPVLISLLDAAVQRAEASGVALRSFVRMSDAHAWLSDLSAATSGLASFVLVEALL
jgi:hypothetical protein